MAIHDVQSEQHPPFLVMEYVPGWSLQDRVEHDGPLAATEILRIGMQAAAGLAAAHHQGVIHRDVKPANILLEKGVERARLTDFGLARAADDATLTHSGIVAGTPHYMSPEQARGATVDARSDLFSLGAVLYFMATGHPPFRAEQAMAILNRICHDRHRSVQSINANIPDSLARTIDRLLEKKPARRFTTATEVQQLLANQLHELQQPRPWRRRVFSKARRYIPPLLAVACVILAAIWLGSASGWFGSAKSDIPPKNAAAGSLTSANDVKAEAAELRSQQTELTNDLVSIGLLLNHLENRGSPQSPVARSGPDSWATQLKEAATSLSRFETQWP